MAASARAWRWESAINPATTAAASRTATPASRPAAGGSCGAGARPRARRGPALVEEIALELVQLGLVLGGPVERRGEPGAAVELGRIAVGVLPFGGGVDQVLVKAPALGVLLEPAAQPRPLAKQRLVGDLDGALVDGDEPAVGEHREGARGVLVALDVELGERDPPADRAWPPRRRPGAAGSPAPAPLGFGQPPVRALRETRDRAADAAARRVVGAAQGASASLLPELEQGGGEQRQAAGLVGDVGDQRLDERRLDARPARRAGSSIARRSSRGVIGPTRTWLALISAASVGVIGAAAVEVGANREHDDHALVGIVARLDERLVKAARSPSSRQAVNISSN